MLARLAGSAVVAHASASGYSGSLERMPLSALQTKARKDGVSESGLTGCWEMLARHGVRNNDTGTTTGGI